MILTKNLHNLNMKAVSHFNILILCADFYFFPKENVMTINFSSIPSTLSII